MDLGLGAEEYADLTDLQFKVLCERVAGLRRREEYRDAQLMLLTAQAGGMKRQGGGRLTLKDFLPTEIVLADPGAEAPAKAGPSRRQTWQEQLQIVEIWNEMFGGTDLRPPPEPLESLMAQ